jgi:hypothetical protein
MECSRCNTSLSIHDLESNEWLNDCEFFSIKCPVCEFITKVDSPLFENEHICSQYLRMIALDSSNNKKEKYTDYVPKKQRELIFEHVSTCEICSSKIESIRLDGISKEIEFNESTYKFFAANAKDVMIELDKTQVYIEESTIKSFVFDGKTYNLSEDNVFYYNCETLRGVEKKRFCYNIDSNGVSIGMVAFVFIDNKIVLEKIWLKQEHRVEKQRQFISNLRSGKTRILFDLIKSRNFV